MGGDPADGETEAERGRVTMESQGEPGVGAWASAPSLSGLCPWLPFADGVIPTSDHG